MTAYALTPLAKADVFEIWSYIANDSELGFLKGGIPHPPTAWESRGIPLIA